MQESGLRNLAYGTSDSLGLFQQRPSQGWGTAAQIMDPVTSSRSFYVALAQVPGWQSMPVTVAAQAVQRSAFPDAYAQWQGIATRLVSSFAGATITLDAVSCVSLDANVVPGGTAANGNVTLPKNYDLPSSTPVAVAEAIRFALHQLGTAYDFGGTCTDAHSPNLALHCDCSSLVQQSYAAAGIQLPRTTFEQVDEGSAVYSTRSLQAGDLLFTAGSDGTPENPGHVGMYIGDNLIVQAPMTGENVQLSTLSSWTSQIVAMRKIV
jgi:cell wall-associated NlpC family hydrolase